MVRYGEGFFTSLGFEPLPESFWERSDLYALPAGAERKKNTHASAWHLDRDTDIRSLMSVEANPEWWEATLQRARVLFRTPRRDEAFDAEIATEQVALGPQIVAVSETGDVLGSPELTTIFGPDLAAISSRVDCVVAVAGPGDLAEAPSQPEWWIMRRVRRASTRCSSRESKGQN